MRRMLTFATMAALASAALLAGVRARRVEARQGRAGENVSSNVVPRPLRPVHTFSIVARDPATGELGVAVQSHWFSVGSNVTWAEAGVGQPNGGGRKRGRG